MTFDVHKTPLTTDQVILLIKRRLAWSKCILGVVLVSAVITNLIGGIANFVGIGVSLSCIAALLLLNRGGFKQYYIVSLAEQKPILEWAQHSNVVFDYVRQVKTQPRNFYKGELVALKKQYDLEAEPDRRVLGK